MAKKGGKVKVVKTKTGVRRVRPRRKNTVPAQEQQRQALNKSLVTIEDSTIKMILADPRYTQTIPCLMSGKKALEGVGKKCGKCSQKRKRLQAEAMGQLKDCIAGLRGDSARNFKKLLGAKKVRVYKPGRGKQRPMPITF